MFKIVKTVFSEIVEWKDVFELINVLRQDEEKYHECLEWIEVNTTLHNGIYIPKIDISERDTSLVKKSLNILEQSINDLEATLKKSRINSTMDCVVYSFVSVAAFNFGWAIPSIIRYFYGN